MLFVAFTKTGFVDSKDVDWHVGEHLNGKAMQTLESDGYRVCLVQADGDELEWLKSHFSNLPHVNHMLVQKWRGDHATFIFDHLPRTWDKP
jgi:hypothetical protein